MITSLRRRHLTSSIASEDESHSFNSTSSKTNNSKLSIIDESPEMDYLIAAFDLIASKYSIPCLSSKPFKGSKFQQSVGYHDPISTPTIEERVSVQMKFQFQDKVPIFQTQYTSIFKAAADGDIHGMKYFILKKKEDVNTIDRKGYAPLHYACQFGQVIIINLLLLCKADIDVTTREELQTPLMIAMKYNQLDVIRILATSKEKPNYFLKTRNGSTGIHLAAQNNHHEVISLIRQIYYEGKGDGCFVRSVDCMEDNSQSESCLIKKYTYYTERDLLDVHQTNGWTPLHIAVEYNSINVIHALLHRNDQNQVNANELLHVVDVNAKDNLNETPLHKAARSYKVAIYRLLIQYGARDDINNIYNQTPKSLLDM